MNLTERRILVNAITLGRLPFVFVFVILAVLSALYEMPLLALFAAFSLIIAALTDLFDGRLARKWGVVSKFGAMSDPLMDKVFYLAVFPTLLWMSARSLDDGHSLLLLGVAISYFLRDQWVTFLRSVASLYNAYCGAMFIGKLRTASTFPIAIAIYLRMAFDSWLEWLPMWVIFAAEAFLIGITVWSLVSYTAAYHRYMRRAIEEGDDHAEK